MATLRIPTPLRPYTDNQAEVAITASNVSGALEQLTEQHPGLAQHLFTEEGRLRSFVNLFLNDEDVRYLDGVETELKEDDRLMIIPSIAGGSEALAKVDHSALLVNQAFLISLNIMAFIINGPWLAALVTAAMLVGTLLHVPGFGFIYKSLLKPSGLVKPDMITDNSEPHRFAQGFGGVVMLGAIIALFGDASVLGWGLVWLVVALAALNLFAGFCVGCAVYYWLNRLGLPGFEKAPPRDVFPGMRPKRQVS